jgi:hypothetical protein
MLSTQLSKQIHFSISHHVAGAGNSDSQAYLHHLLQSFTPNIFFNNPYLIGDINHAAVFNIASENEARDVSPELLHWV